jgi:uncharacterized protein with HEPN domain
MSKRSIKLLLEDILEAISKIESYTQNISQTGFLSDLRTIDAVVRNLEIIGEASNRLPVDFKETHSGISWAQIVGLRHRIVHDYFDVDIELVWQIIQNDLPNLKPEIERLQSSED